MAYCSTDIMHECDMDNCIPLAWTCDEEADCIDKSDEDEVICSKTSYLIDIVFFITICRSSIMPLVANNGHR